MFLEEDVAVEYFKREVNTVSSMNEIPFYLVVLDLAAQTVRDKCFKAWALSGHNAVFKVGF